MMILLIRRKWILGSMAFLLVAATVLSFFAKPPAVPALSYIELSKAEIIILDAGHGGSDGGAVSADGTPESGINLDITLRLQDFFTLMGCQTMLTRTDAASLADPDSTTLRQEKVSDTKNRVALINSVSGGSLISIHQNTLPGYQTVHGAQVFYGTTDTSDMRAQSVQKALNSAVNQGNEKTSKPIGSDIYIMAHVSCPAILVECGFLSNSTETKMLLTPEYQTKLAVAIGCGYLQYR